MASQGVGFDCSVLRLTDNHWLRYDAPNKRGRLASIVRWKFVLPTVWLRDVKRGTKKNADNEFDVVAEAEAILRDAEAALV